MRSVLLYVVLYPVVLMVAMFYLDNKNASKSIGDYLVEPYLWTFVPAILLSIGIDVYQKGKQEEAKDLKTIDNTQEQSKEASDEKEKL